MPIRGGGSPGRRSRRAQLSNRLCSSSLARPSETPSPRGPQAAIAGAVAVRVRGPVKAVRREERAMESKSSEGKSMPEEGTIGGKPTPEERVTEGKPTPEGAVMEGKSVAAECKRTGSHEAAGACECGLTKAAPSEATAEAAAKGRPSEAATAEAATAKCGRPKPPRPKPPPPSAGRPKPPPPKPPWKAEALNVEAAVAIAAAASPITILRITMLTPCQETHASRYVAKLGSSYRVAGVAQSLGLFRTTAQSREARAGAQRQCLLGNAIGCWCPDHFWW